MIAPNDAPLGDNGSKSEGGCCSGGSSCGSAASAESPPALIQINVQAAAHRSRPRLEPARFTPTDRYPQGLLMGLDVGSTTVKFTLIDPATDDILWKDYQRHDTRQPEKVIEMLEAVQQRYPDVPHGAYRIFMTGSGAGSIAPRLGARFVQEVNAVSLAVEKLYPEVQSVIELGGQDAKIIVFKPAEDDGRKKKIPSMNDKCAGGTGAVIDKINAKLKIPPEQLCQMAYNDIKLHPVAGKCGVFAETDINGLQKSGVPGDQLMASLFESIVMQNLSVLTRGHTLKPVVLLLGGPNCYIQGMQECWRHNIPVMWQERNVALPEGKTLEELIVVPDNAQYFAAIGAVEFGKREIEDDPHQGVYRGLEELKWFVDVGRIEEKKAAGSTALVKSAEELASFLKRYEKKRWQPRRFEPGHKVPVFIGLDGGSTSTKGVLLDRERHVVAKAYQLSRGNPIEDTMDIFAQLEEQISDMGCTMEVLGVGTTGYAKDILKDVLRADVALVETVAHAESGLHFYPGTDVIVDVGGQDIKLIILKNGQVKDFKLNTQCSAGNGYFLQSTAQTFGYAVEDYAEAAFAAEAMPEFGYGCAVFMQSDIVDFQRQGWKPNEIMAGLAAVLPKNIWLYVSQIPNLPKLGTRFVLQGGTQHNLAAVKAQVDFISSRFAGTGVEPEIIVHQHCGESGAIGCALEAQRLWSELDHRTEFIGMEAVRRIQYRTTRNEDTRCYFCKNKCLRTFIDVKTVARKDTVFDLSSMVLKQGPEQGHASRMKQGAAEAETPAPQKFKSKVPMQDGEQRLIIATCEKGTVEDVNDMRSIKSELDAVKKANPNLVEISAREVFKPVTVETVADAAPRVTPLSFPRRKVVRARARLIENRPKLKIGVPRVLNMYSQMPFFMGYFQSLGLDARQIIYSDYTTEELYKQGAKRGSIDPCFPSKVGIPHVHNLLYHKHAKHGLTHIFFPMIDSMPTFLHGVQASRSCPTVAITPEAVHAAFTKESDLFAEKGIVFKKTFVNLDNAGLCARQMYLDWRDELGVSEEESYRATLQGLRALDEYNQARREQAREVLERLQREQKLGLVLLARPYHNDPGINHEICEELQKLGFPVFTEDSLPIDAEILESLFGREVQAGAFAHPLSVEDAWKNSYSENTTRKVWSAKYTARHPNLVALELSSFKCGHDAPIYSVIEEIIENSRTPYFCFKDIDENKPTGSIKIRIETIAYFLKRYQQNMGAEQRKRREIEDQVAEYEARLRRRRTAPQPAGVPTAAVVGV